MKLDATIDTGRFREIAQHVEVDELIDYLRLLINEFDALVQKGKSINPNDGILVDALRAEFRRINELVNLASEEVKERVVSQFPLFC